MNPVHCSLSDICLASRVPSVAYLSMEMLHRQLPEAFRRRCQRGGLGILAGDTADALERLVQYLDGWSISPLYDLEWDVTNSTPVSYKDFGWPETEVTIEYEGRKYSVTMFEMNSRRIGVANSDVFTVLYPDDRGMRLKQEMVFCKAVAEYFAATRPPQVVWQNESHVAPIASFLSRPYPAMKFLFVIHTPMDSGMERYNADRFPVTGIPDEDRPIYVPHNGEVMDFPFAAMAQCHRASAVSKEHGEITRRMFPYFRNKIGHVTNGVSSEWWDERLRPYVGSASGTLPLETLMAIHQEGRECLNDIIEQETFIRPDAEEPLVGFIRRSQEYKAFPLLTSLLPVLCAKRGEYVDMSFGRVRGLGLQVAIASIAPESDGTCMGWMTNMSRLSNQGFRGKFFFINKYNQELLQAFAQGLDCHVEAPWPGCEACGTSHERTMCPTIASWTGGMIENIMPIDRVAGMGNGWFVDPYDERTLYEKLAEFSDTWYAWRERGDSLYPRIMRNVLRQKADVDIKKTIIEGYAPLIRRMIAA